VALPALSAGWDAIGRMSSVGCHHWGAIIEVL